MSKRSFIYASLNFNWELISSKLYSFMNGLIIKKNHNLLILIKIIIMTYILGLNCFMEIHPQFNERWQ